MSVPSTGAGLAGGGRVQTLPGMCQAWAQVDDPFFGATKYEKVQGCQARDSPLASQLHLQRERFNVGPRSALPGQRLHAATARQSSTRTRNRNEAKASFYTQASPKLASILART